MRNENETDELKTVARSLANKYEKAKSGHEEQVSSPHECMEQLQGLAAVTRPNVERWDTRLIVVAQPSQVTCWVTVSEYACGGAAVSFAALVEG